MTDEVELDVSLLVDSAEGPVHSIRPLAGGPGQYEWERRSNWPIPSRDPGDGGANNRPGVTPTPSTPPPPQRGD